jgi:NADPH2:quinone reductase
MPKSVNVFLETVFTNMLFNYQQEMQSEILSEMADLLKDGKIKSTLTVTLNGLSLENIRKAHALLEAGNVIGKIVVEI